MNLNVQLKEILKSKDEFKRAVKKSLTTADVERNGAELEPAQFGEYLRLLRGASTVLKDGLIRVETVKDVRGKIGRLHLTSPITRAAEAPEDGTETGKVLLDSVPYECKKLRSRSIVDIDALYNAAGGYTSLEDAIMAMSRERNALDWEDLAFNGDATTYAAINTPYGYLRRSNDGFVKLAESGMVIDAGGGYMTEDLLEEALDAVPGYARSARLAWMMNIGLRGDFKRLARAKGGDLAARTYISQPMGVDAGDIFGVGYLDVNCLPNSRAVVTQAATPAQIISSTTGPWEITAGSNDKMRFTIDAVDKTITIPAGLRYASEIAALINAAYSKNLARSWDGYLLITSGATPGAASVITVTAIANSAYLTLTPASSGGGLVAGETTNGANAGSGGTMYEGGTILLTDPKNLTFIVHDSVRMTVKYDDDVDALKITKYDHVDMVIEDPQSVVMIKNVRKKRSA